MDNVKLVALKLKNYRAFKNVEIKNIPNFCVFVGANGVGKSTIFSVFNFLKNAIESNVNVALGKIGGANGFNEVRSRNSTGPIEIELKFVNGKSPLITYFLAINEKNGYAYVEKEVLKYKRGNGGHGKPWNFLDFSDGKGTAITNETVVREEDFVREYQSLKSNDILAIRGLGQFEKFPAVMALSNLIENWHISDFHIEKARTTPELGFSQHLSKEGENLPLVIQYLNKLQDGTFEKILDLLSHRIPGINKIEAKTTEEGRVLLKFQDNSFQDPFLAQFVSDGTIKMLAYLVLLYDPNPHSLLCIEEPENQLYPSLMEELAEDFRSYSNRGGQVFVSTHSPDFLNALQPEEVFCLIKKNGYTYIEHLSDNDQIVDYINQGDKLGYLWKQGFIEGVDPR